jgi:hypothetical protein
MINCENCIRYADAFIDCIPVVRILYNASLMWYKSAYKVNSLSPVTPGLGTSIKIHVLSKPWSSCAIGAVPVFGNLYRFVELVRAFFCGFKEDYLTRALAEGDSEVVRLSLANAVFNNPIAKAGREKQIEQHIRKNGLYIECLKPARPVRNEWQA